MIDFDALKAPFPMDAISWRAQTLSKDGTKALALAYVDARDVMNRLDEVCSPAGWQCKYSHANGKTVCDIGIKVSPSFYKDRELQENAEWVWKADGAGDSDIEAEKGALSDAFKRAAVRWGIGRYLYDLESPWVPCESYETNGKKRWSKFTKDPWACIEPKVPRGKSVFDKPILRSNFHRETLSLLNACKDSSAITALMEEHKEMLAKMDASTAQDDVSTALDLRTRARSLYAQFKSLESTLTERAI